MRRLHFSLGLFFILTIFQNLSYRIVNLIKNKKWIWAGYPAQLPSLFQREATGGRIKTYNMSTLLQVNSRAIDSMYEIRSFAHEFVGLLREDFYDVAYLDRGGVLYQDEFFLFFPI